MSTRHRGRPPLREGEGSTSVNVRFPNSEYDERDRTARACRLSLPELIRRSVRNGEPVPYWQTLTGVIARLEVVERELRRRDIQDIQAAALAAETTRILGAELHRRAFEVFRAA